jgi:predicted nucleotidyltransferase
MLARVSKASVPSLNDLARRLVDPLRRAGVLRAVAFGSFARGTQDEYSDLDLAVVVDTQLPRFERHLAVSELYDASPVGLDLLVLTPEEFERGLSSGYDIFDAIAREGITIHEQAP